MTDWRHRAACRDVDPETFYPAAEEGTAAYARDAARALAICDACPVRAECLNDALARGDTWAILGGTTPDERSRYLRARAQARRLVTAGP